MCLILCLFSSSYMHFAIRKKRELRDVYFLLDFFAKRQRNWYYETKVFSKAKPIMPIINNIQKKLIIAEKIFNIVLFFV